MNFLADNALVIWVAGAVALTMAMVVYLQTRSGRALAAAGTVIALTAALLVAEHLLETPREAVERTLYELADTVEANDVPGTLAYLAPNALPETRADVERLMPLVEIEVANVVGTPRIELSPEQNPNTATVQCRGVIVARIKQSGMKGGEDAALTLTFVRHGDRWLLEGYTSDKNWHGALGR